MRQRTLMRTGALIAFGLVALALATIASPTGLAASEKPRPDTLWEAFPLDPTSGRRPTTPLLPPAQERVEATTVTEASSEASGSHVFLLALGGAALLVLLAAVGVLSATSVHLRSRELGGAVQPWQGISWPEQLRDGAHDPEEAGARTGLAHRGEHPTRAQHPDVPARAYRWADPAPIRRSASRRRISSPRPTWTTVDLAHRFRRAVWTEDTAPAIIGAAVAVATAFAFIHWIG